MDHKLPKTFIVDDEPNAAQLLQKLLEPYAIFGAVSVFTNATIAFNKIIEQQPEFLFLDIQMPELSGLQLAEKIKTHAPHAKIIYVTAYEQYALDALRQNAFDYLLKPVNKAELVRIVEKLLVVNERKFQTQKLPHNCAKHGGDIPGANQRNCISRSRLLLYHAGFKQPVEDTFER